MTNPFPLLFGLLLLVSRIEPVIGGGSWATKAAYPNTVVAQFMVSVGAEVFSFGGYIPPHTAAVYKYETLQDAWAAVTAMPTARADVAGVARGGEVWLIGGGNDPGAPSANEKYLVNTDVWALVADMPSGRPDLGVAAVGDDAYAIGGYPAFTVCEKYSLLGDTWTTFHSIPVAGTSCRAGAVDTDVVALLPTDLFKYDTLTASWTTLSPFPQNQIDRSAMTVDGSFNLVVVGGYDTPTSRLSSVYLYTAATDGWESLEPMPTARGNFPVVTHGNTLQLHTVGGDLSGSLTEVHEVYTLDSASLQGDPLLTTFSGESTLLHLSEGVFSLFAAGALAVNVLVEHVNTLPPEENTVVTHVAVATTPTTARNSTHVVHCDSYTQMCFAASDDTTTPSCHSSVMALEGQHHICTIDFGTAAMFVIDVFFTAVAVIELDSSDVVVGEFPTTHYLDVRVRGKLPHHHGTVGGMLGDAETSGFEYVREKLAIASYSPSTGVLMDFHTAACDWAVASYTRSTGALIDGLPR